VKLSDAWDNYYANTGKASEITRSLALAALALVWIFKDSDGRLPKVLLVPSALAMLALACDLAQYVVGATKWKQFADSKDRVAKTLDDDIGQAPGDINVVPERFYVAKFGLILAAYFVLFCYAGARLFS